MKKHFRAYQAKNGATQYKPSMRFVMSMDDNEGVCLACRNTQSGVEPDVGKYTCECCGEPKVYGRELIVLMGLTW